ncbi:MAG: nucleotidyltransferase domain-containing protein [Candidatus Margulisbacteria bacterium]|nr:nucleotidyltransferase domain-containing protein [Candidatus Margulisiibacteriota bacterium]
MIKIPDKIKETIDLFLNDINHFCSLDKVVLYGSFAKGKGTAESDIDIAIFSRQANNSNRLSLMAKIFTKVPKYKLDFQPLVFSFQDYLSPGNDFLQQEIINKGMILR